MGAAKILSADQTPASPAWERWEPNRFNETSTKAATTVSARADAAANSVADHAGMESLRAATHAEAYRAGFESGRHDGLEAGREAAQAEGRALAMQLGGAIARFDQGVAQLEKDVAQELLNLALGIARRIVGDTLEAQPEVVLASIREALAQLPAQHSVIHLNSEDAELIRTQSGDALARAGHRIHENPQLSRGDVLVEAGGTQIDARLETRWQRVWESVEPEPVARSIT
jgi:flagellar assembly protein FliH